MSSGQSLLRARRGISGELIVKDGKSSLRTTSDLQAFALIVTAEPDFAVAQPSDLIVAQNEIRHDTKGGIEPVDVTFQLISRDTYNSQVQPINSTVYDVSDKTPLDLLEARNSVRIAKDAGAQQYAASELQKAQDSLNRAEDYYRRKQGSGPIGTVAREAVPDRRRSPGDVHKTGARRAGGKGTQGCGGSGGAGSSGCASTTGCSGAGPSPS